jgi:hypothetical protein
MKVKYTELKKTREGRPLGSGLTVGREYEVLAIEFDPTQGILFRIIGNDRTMPALYLGELFEIIDPAIPRTWVVGRNTRGWYAIAPQPWTVSGFWERFFDREPEALLIFEEQCQLMKIL